MSDLSDDAREYAYKPKWTVIVTCVVFSAACCVVLGFKAANNDRGLIINGVIQLGRDGATVFYAAIAAMSVGFVGLGAFLAYHRLVFHQRLRLDAVQMTLPASRWSHEEREIAYRDILGFRDIEAGGELFLEVLHTQGKQTITAAMLPSKAAFEEVRQLLAARVREAHRTDGMLDTSHSE